MRKYVALFLAFSIFSLSGNLFGKERIGAELYIQKKDGFFERGELIAVKENSLLLLERESGADVSVELTDITIIKIVKRSKALMGIGLGFLIGGSIGAAFGYLVANIFRFYPDPWWRTEDVSEVYGAALTCGEIGAGIGVLIGGIVGGLAGTDKTIQVAGRSDEEIERLKEYLRPKARVKNYQ